MHGGFITGKAIDNRSSCVAVMRAAELLKNEDKPYGLSVTLTTREEVGGHGCAGGGLHGKPHSCDNGGRGLWLDA